MRFSKEFFRGRPANSRNVPETRPNGVSLRRRIQWFWNICSIASATAATTNVIPMVFILKIIAFSQREKTASSLRPTFGVPGFAESIASSSLNSLRHIA